MIRIGLTGGIGSGKSTVAAMLAGQGAVVIDADQIARDIVEPGEPALARLVAEFGPRILTEEGALDRQELAALAFSSPEGTQRLNAIMHPLIREEAARRLAAVPGDRVVVYDMPLLVEIGQRDLVDVIVVVDVPEEVQVERAVHQRGLQEQDVRRRMQAQASRQERLSMADVVVDNSGSLASTRDQVEAAWRRLVREAP